MNYKIAVCDDEQDQTEYILSILAAWGRQYGCNCDVSVFDSAESFLFDYEDHKTWDILLLDVEMKNMTGIELARRIRKDDSRTEIIFTTAHFEFAGEGYEVDALHYLVKPVRGEQLQRRDTPALRIRYFVRGIFSPLYPHPHKGQRVQDQGEPLCLCAEAER